MKKNLNRIFFEREKLNFFRLILHFFCKNSVFKHFLNSAFFFKLWVKI